MTSRFEEDEGRPCVETLAIAEIKQDEEIAARPIDPAVATEYAERMAAGDVFPPLEVMRDDNGVNWLWNGWHRLEAATRNGLASIDCAIRKGDRRAALLASAGANATHGLRRSAEVKRRDVLKLLTDAEWGKWSDREIARRCKVSNTFVGDVRASIVTVNADSENDDGHRRFRTRHGGVSTMNTADIGAKQPARSLREIAAAGPRARATVEMSQLRQERRPVVSIVSIVEAARPGTARAVARALDDLSLYADQCGPEVLEAVRVILLADSEKLARVRRAIGLAIRVKATLDDARGRP
jgi:hypothetical protein